MSKDDCLQKIKSIYKAGEDQYYPVRAGVKSILLLASQEGYSAETEYGIKEHDSAQGLYEDLLDVENLDEDMNEEEAISSLLQNLEAL